MRTTTRSGVQTSTRKPSPQKQGQLVSPKPSTIQPVASPKHLSSEAIAFAKQQEYAQKEADKSKLVALLKLKEKIFRAKDAFDEHVKKTKEGTSEYYSPEKLHKAIDAVTGRIAKEHFVPLDALEKECDKSFEEISAAIMADKSISEEQKVNIASLAQRQHDACDRLGQEHVNVSSVPGELEAESKDAYDAIENEVKDFEGEVREVVGSFRKDEQIDLDSSLGEKIGVFRRIMDDRDAELEKQKAAYDEYKKALAKVNELSQGKIWIDGDFEEKAGRSVKVLKEVTAQPFVELENKYGGEKFNAASRAFLSDSIQTAKNKSAKAHRIAAQAMAGCVEKIEESIRIDELNKAKEVLTKEVRFLPQLVVSEDNILNFFAGEYSSYSKYVVELINGDRSRVAHGIMEIYNDVSNGGDITKALRTAKNKSEEGCGCFCLSIFGARKPAVATVYEELGNLQALLQQIETAKDMVQLDGVRAAFNACKENLKRLEGSKKNGKIKKLVGLDEIPKGEPKLRYQPASKGSPTLNIE